MPPQFEISFSLAASPDFEDLDIRATDMHFFDVLEPIVLESFFIWSQFRSRLDRLPEKPVINWLGTSDYFGVDTEDGFVRHRFARVEPSVLTGNRESCMEFLHRRCKEKWSELQWLFRLGLLTGLLGVHGKQILTQLVDLIPLFIILATGLGLVGSQRGQGVLTNQGVLR